MRSAFIILLGLCLLFAMTLADNNCKKVCPKIRKPIAARRPDGSCTVYSNNCVLLNDILCNAQAFSECYRGEACLADKSKAIRCGTV